MKKKVDVIILVLSVVVVILSITLLKISSDPQPKLIGSYQSETMPPDIYMLSFFQDGTYEVYENSNLVDEGTYISTDTDEAYLIKSEQENQLIVLSKDDNFYYYSPDQSVYLMKNLDKYPVSLGEPN
ncbi:hypothetical protein [Jeotgalibaca porci]|uniref:Uncharacterized protein n=2 Tax=Jeotgalibaca porci TaxID=1868793 RepID=A0A6G7WFV5_9LACT|nr:hypothetical protein [Jeotgalibaca porci]QIK51111.1 hypothetical protein G7058_02970 [Jeotgalibaca porci]